MPEEPTPVAPELLSPGSPPAPVAPETIPPGSGPVLDPAVPPVFDDLTPLPVTDLARLTGGWKNGQTIVVNDQGGRVEKFLGARTDPTRFFVRGATPLTAEIGEDEPTFDPNAWYLAPDPAALAEYHAQSPNESNISFGRSGEGTPWRILDPYTETDLWTAGQVTEWPWQVTSWTPNAEVHSQPFDGEILPFDTSGIAWLSAATPALTAHGPFLVPAGFSSGRPAFADAGQNSACTWQPAGTGGPGWYLETLDYTWWSPEDVAWPWLVETWTLAGEPAVPPEDDLALTRCAAANNDNWAVLKNTVRLSVVVNIDPGASLSLNGVALANGPAAQVGWVDPFAIPATLTGNLNLISIGPAGVSSVSLTDCVLYPQAALALPVPVPPRAEVEIELAVSN